MNFDRFSLGAFESLAGDAQAARRLADDLQQAVLAELRNAVGEKFQSIVDELNARGHRLSPSDVGSSPGEWVYLDDTDPTCCSLRLAFDLIISAGYKDMQGEGGWAEILFDE